jgi:hypothetical protein
MSKSFILMLIAVSFCFADSDSLPNPSLSPGDTIPGAGALLCTPGYSKSVRHVSGSTKHKVYEEYGITSRKPAEYEVDHLISLELGGSNDIQNLWPQSYVTQPWNAHKKDVLENKLHQLVCSGQIPLHQAQYEIAHDWIAAYKKYVGNK